MKARNAGAAVLLVSEDLDELLELSDRILVMARGRAGLRDADRRADRRARRVMGGQPSATRTATRSHRMPH